MSTTKLHIGNLSYTTTAATLQAAFAAEGRKVQSVAIQMSKAKGEPRGFAFVEMGNEADALAAIASLNGREIDGRAIKVDEARGRLGGIRPA